MARYIIQNRAVITERRVNGEWLAKLEDRPAYYTTGATEVEAVNKLRQALEASEAQRVAA